MLESALLTVHNVTTEVRVVIGGVTQHFEEAADAFFGLILGFLLQVDSFVSGLVQVGEDLVDEF